jgi:hypothetical protein
MRKILLLMSILGVSIIPAIGQAPGFWISDDIFSKEMAAGSVDSQLVIIQNTGNRDLEWGLKDVHGASVTFTKEDYADWTLAENQDRIAGTVWITRANERGIFNAAVEEEYEWFSPENTVWAAGKSMNNGPGDYSTWGEAINWNPPNMVGKTFSLFITEYFQFYDVVFHNWTQGISGIGQGGGFSYTRTEVPRWLSATNTSGSLIPGEFDSVWVYFNTERLVQNDYTAIVELNTNDPEMPVAVVTFNLNVSSGIPETYIDESLIAFGEVFVNNPETYELKIYNEGNGDLEISSVAFNTPAFTSPTASLTVPALNFQSLDIVFTPVLKADYSDTLYLATSDTVNPLIKIPLYGTGIAPADIQVNPSAIQETIPQGAVFTTKIVISNTDSSDLEWGIDVQADLVKTGGEVTFSKVDYSDYTQPANQDIWSPNVTITRANSQGIFNIVNESSYQWDSPTGTLWSYGHTGEVEQDNYEIWRDAIMSNPLGMIDNQMTVYLPDDDIFYDILFHSWTSGGSGGGFSYTRQLYSKWLGVSEASGTTSIEEADTIVVSVDATGMVNGTYTGNLVVYSNDPDEGEITIPVEVTVTGGVQEISISEPIIDFGDVFAGDTKTFALEIENKGTGDLTVSGITTFSDKFEVSPSSFTLNGNSAQTVDIAFSPASVESVLDTLAVASDDPVNPVIKIGIIANVLAPPAIELVTQDISVDILSDEIIVYKLPVKNTGDNDLEYEISGEETVIFTKEDYANWQLPENQDRITDNVWITRATIQGLFNVATENSFDPGTSPEGTEWAYGASGELEPEDYDVWVNAIGWYPPGMVGNVLSLHLTEEDLYYDVEFTSWTQGGNGGGFSYTRTKQLPGWLQPSYTSGIVPPGETDTIELSFIATGLNEQVYHTTFLMNTNVPDNKNILFNATMNVTGMPDISVSTMNIDFGLTYIGFPDTLQVMVSNTGTDSLTIGNMTTQTGFFETVESELLVMPGEEKPLQVVFNPDALQEYIDTLRFTTNVTDVPSMWVSLRGEGVNPPALSVEPESLSYLTYYNQALNDSIILFNNGDGPAVWSAHLVNRNISINDVLINLNAKSADILSQIPNRYIFAYDGDDYSINDGGNDMYDGGNYLTTSPGFSEIMYSDDVVANGDMYFGDNTEYFTRHLDGLFILAADMNGVESFHIDGNLGADGSGNYNSTILDYEYYGIRFKGYVKRVYNASDPSVNHLIIVEENPAVMQTIGTNTNDDMHYLEGLSENSRIYYLLYAGASGYYIDDINTTSIMEAFISSVYATPEWIKLNYSPDIIASSSSDTIGIMINTTGMTSGDYDASIYIASNDPEKPVIEVPVNLKVKGVTVVNPLEDMLVNEGFGSDTVDFSGVFEDAEADPLSYTIVSTKPDVVTVDTIGMKIVISETGTGTSTITIRADDGSGNVEYEDFLFRVNANPLLVAPIADTTVNEGFSVSTVDLSAVFADPDDDVLKYSLTNSSPGTVTVSVAGDTLTIQEVASGTSTITVTASDTIGIPVADEFVFTVNALPVVINAINDTTVNEGFTSYTIDLASVFDDTDNETLAYEFTNSNPAAVTISVNGDVLTVQEVAYGVSTVSVSASDNSGTPASDEFVVTVNAIPVVANALADISMDEGFGTHTVNLSTVFSDNDDTQLELAASSDNTAVVTVSVDASNLVVTEAGIGSANITVTAEDSKGAGVSDVFVFTVADVESLESLKDAGISLYPNPTKGKIYLSVEKGENRLIAIEFTNIAGEVVMNDRFNYSGRTRELDLTSFAKGMYFMKITSDDYSLVKKIIIE